MWRKKRFSLLRGMWVSRQWDDSSAMYRDLFACHDEPSQILYVLATYVLNIRPQAILGYNCSKAAAFNVRKRSSQIRPAFLEIKLESRPVARQSKWMEVQLLMAAGLKAEPQCSQELKVAYNRRRGRSIGAACGVYRSLLASGF